MVTFNRQQLEQVHSPVLRKQERFSFIHGQKSRLVGQWSTYQESYWHSLYYDVHRYGTHCSEADAKLRLKLLTPPRLGCRQQSSMSWQDPADHAQLALAITHRSNGGHTSIIHILELLGVNAQQKGSTWRTDVSLRTAIAATLTLCQSGGAWLTRPLSFTCPGWVYMLVQLGQA